MLDLRQVKELIADPNISDQEAAEIRNVCYALAALAVDSWKSNKQRENKASSSIREENALQDG